MTDRGTAETTRSICIVTIWTSKDARDTGGWALRATDRLTSMGEVAVVGDYEYPQYAAPLPATRRGINMNPDAYTFSIMFDRGGPLTPDVANFRSAWAEVAWVNEAADGLSVATAWADRDVRVQGPIEEPVWRRPGEMVSFTISPRPMRMDAPIVDPDQIIDFSRFSDAAYTGASGGRDRAYNSAGLPPPLYYGADVAPESTVYVPGLCVRDEVAATLSTTDVTFRTFLLARDPIPSPASSRTINLRDPGATDRVIQEVATTSIAMDSDDEGRPFLGLTSGLVFSASDTFDSASGDATIGKATGFQREIGQQIVEGDIVKFSGDDATHWLDVDSITGSNAMELSSTYGANNSAQTLVVSRLTADAPDPILWEPGSYGGHGGAWADGPIRTLLQLSQKLLSSVDLGGVRVHPGDLQAIDAHLGGILIHAPIVEDESAWDWVRREQGAMVPVIPYRDGDLLRFYLDPELGDVGVTTKIDFDEQLDAQFEGWRLERNAVIDQIRVQYGHSLLRGQFRGTFVIGAGIRSSTYRQDSARMAGAYATDRDSDNTHSRVYERASKAFNLTRSAAVAAGVSGISMGQQQMTATARLPTRYRFLKRFDIIELEWAESIPSGFKWRVTEIEEHADWVKPTFRTIAR